MGPEQSIPGITSVAPTRSKVVVLGMMTKMPVAGVVWQTMHYLVGLERLGFEAYYVETHARTPSMLMRHEDDDSSLIAADFIARTMRRFDLDGRWAFQALHDDGRCYGMSERKLERLLDSAHLLINLHGGTEPLPELAAGGRLVYLETDPVQLQLELHAQRPETLRFLEPHCAFFTFGENIGNPDCPLPTPDRFNFQPTRQPVVLDLWRDVAAGAGSAFTTIGNWRQDWRDVRFEGETYTWSKHHEFLRFLDLPARSGPGARARAVQHRRRMTASCSRARAGASATRSSSPRTSTPTAATSRLAGRVHRRQGPERAPSDRLVQRPERHLPRRRPAGGHPGHGLRQRCFRPARGCSRSTSIDDAVAALEAIERDYESHCAAAEEIARAFFCHEVVLTRLLSSVGAELSRSLKRQQARGSKAFPADMSLGHGLAPAHGVAALHGGDHAEATSAARRPGAPARRREREPRRRDPRRPRLHPAVPRERAGPHRRCRPRADRRGQRLGRRHPGVPRGAGRAELARQGRAERRQPGLLAGLQPGARARSRRPPRLPEQRHAGAAWLAPPPALAHRRRRGRAGRPGDEPDRQRGRDRDRLPHVVGVPATSPSAGPREHPGEGIDIPVATMFCLAMRRDVFERLGPLDERFEIGLLEDDDYSERARRAGLRVRCADDVFVHHFGEASFGKLVPTGEYADILRENKQRFAEKWRAPWMPYGRRQSTSYRALTQRIRELVVERVPPDATVLVVSRGDDELLSFEGRLGVHFPQAENGVYAGYYPADSAEAIEHLETLRAQGGGYFLIPRTSFWWLDHYDGLGVHLAARYRELHREEACVVFELNGVVMSVDAIARPPRGDETESRLARIRERLATTSEGDARLRVLLVLAHEALRQRSSVQDDSAGAGRERTPVAPVAAERSRERRRVRAAHRPHTRPRDAEGPGRCEHPGGEQRRRGASRARLRRAPFPPGPERRLRGPLPGRRRRRRSTTSSSAGRAVPSSWFFPRPPTGGWTTTWGWRSTSCPRAAPSTTTSTA